MPLLIHVKNQKHFTRHFFIKIEKPYFELILDPFVLKILEKGFFQPHHFLSQMTELTTCKYSEHFYKRFRRKPPDERTKRQTEKQRDRQIDKRTNERNVFHMTSLRGSSIGFLCNLQNILWLATLKIIQKFII